MFCPWCAKEREDDSIAIHHCGPTDRPPVFCMACGRPLEGAAFCQACGTQAGEKPAMVAAPSSAAQAAQLAPGGGVAVAAVATATAPAAVGPLDGGGPTIGAAPPTGATTKAAPVAAHGAAPAAGLSEGHRLCRAGMFWSSLVGTLAFFITWGAFPVSAGARTVTVNLTGITIVEGARWHWWNPPSPEFLFILLLLALALSVIGYRTESKLGDRLVTVVSVVLLVLVADVVYELRHVYSFVTGFWIVVGASVALVGFAVGSTVLGSRE